VIEQWHPGLREVSAAGLPQGVTREAVEEWRNLKRELGFECAAIDKVVSESPVVGQRLPSTTARDTLASALAGKMRERFDWVRRWFVESASHEGLASYWPHLIVLVLGMSTVLFLSALWPIWPNYTFPSYHDRRFWTAYNTLGAPGIEGAHGRMRGARSLDFFWSTVANLRPGGPGGARVPT